MAKISHADLVEVIGEKTLGTTDRHEIAKEVAAFIVSENGKIDLDSLVRDIMLYRQDRGYIEATAVSANSLQPNIIADVKELLQDEFPDAVQITVDTRVDPEVIGGVRIELPRQRLDLTVQAKINRFKRLTNPERN